MTSVLTRGTDNMQAKQTLAILVIRCDDSRAHIYQDLEQLLWDVSDDRSAMEFFSVGGHRLATTFDPTWRIQGVVEGLETPDPDFVLQRLRSVVRNMRQFLQDNPDLVEKAGLTISDGLTRLPLLSEAPLNEALLTWSPVLGHSQLSDTADPWHNFWVHGIF